MIPPRLNFCRDRDAVSQRTHRGRTATPNVHLRSKQNFLFQSTIAKFTVLYFHLDDLIQWMKHPLVFSNVYASVLLPFRDQILSCQLQNEPPKLTPIFY